MYEIRKTERFARWIDTLKDIQARARILVRIQRLQAGLFGDVKALGSGISEVRVDYGPGYRIYFKREGKQVVILLAGGDKRTQSRDIKLAIQLSKSLEE